jgi:DNA-binding beta-propeller fold protein YncE
VAVSPDGKTVYVSSSSSASVVAFARDATTGALTRLGCYQGTPRPGVPCGAASLMPSASSPVVSADGSALYVAAPLAGAVASLDSSDSLHTPAGVIPAASVGATATAAPASTGTAATGAATTGAATASPAGSATDAPSTAIPDLSSIFATSLGGDELLNPCIAVNGLDGACSVGVATQGLEDLALSPDGKQIYGAASGSAAIDVFTHAAAGGLSESGCVKRDAPAGLCSSTSILNEPNKLALSPDGKNVYVADKAPGGFSGGQVDVLARNATTGALSPSGCVQFAAKPAPKEEEGSEEGGEGEEENEEAKPAPKGKRASTDCSSAAGLDNVSVVAVSGDGSSVYAIGNGAAAIFSRDAATGQLSEASCAVDEDPRCTSFPPLEGVTDAAVSPDGHQVYVVAFGTNAVRVFGIGAAVTSGHAATTRAGTARVSVACPSGLRRACSGRVQLTRTTARAARHGRHGGPGVHVRRVAAGASAAFSIAPGRHAEVRVRLTRHVRRLLARRHRVRLMAVVRASPSAGGSGYGHHVTLLLRRR